jgi:hypothetical protein
MERSDHEAIVCRGFPTAMQQHVAQLSNIHGWSKGRTY